MFSGFNHFISLLASISRYLSTHLKQPITLIITSHIGMPKRGKKNVQSLSVRICGSSASTVRPALGYVTEDNDVWQNTPDDAKLMTTQDKHRAIDNFILIPWATLYAEVVWKANSIQTRVFEYFGVVSTEPLYFHFLIHFLNNSSLYFYY